MCPRLTDHYTKLAVKLSLISIDEVESMKRIFNESDIKEAILEVSSKDFRRKITDISNPYGDGKSSPRIVDILLNLEINSKLLNKQLTY